MKAKPKRVDEVVWKWFGQPGHFICADDCVHHLHTHIGKYCISTVGDYRPASQAKPTDWRYRMKAETIGCDRTHETMVFVLNDDGETTGQEIDFAAANSNADADVNHMQMCEKYARLTEQPAKKRSKP